MPVDFTKPLISRTHRDGQNAVVVGVAAVQTDLTLVATHSGARWIVDKNGKSVCLTEGITPQMGSIQFEVVNDPGDSIVPWTQKTCPKPLPTIKSKSTGDYYQVSKATSSGLYTAAGWQRWDTLAKEYVHVTPDGERPCGTPGDTIDPFAEPRNENAKLPSPQNDEDDNGDEGMEDD